MTVTTGPMVDVDIPIAPRLVGTPPSPGGLSSRWW